MWWQVRNVEYKDPVAEEWEKFQKTIQREDEVGSAFVFSYMPAYLYLCALSLLIYTWKVSEALLLERDEETKDEREMMEVNEQV